jgi:hypothetical protein
MMNELRLAIREIICEQRRASTTELPDKHRTMSGKTVSFGCRTCVQDLDNRIEDAKFRRDACPLRSDSREHYNGILKVLRRELRGARKILENS